MATINFSISLQEGKEQKIYEKIKELNPDIAKDKELYLMIAIKYLKSKGIVIDES